VFSATPGAVNAASLRRGITRGFWPALLVQLGSLMGDMVWAAIALTGSAFLVQNRPVSLLLGIVGSLFLLRQALLAWQGARHGEIETAGEAPAGRDFVTGVCFSLTNPFAVAFWLGMGAGVIASAHSRPGAAVFFFAGFFLGAVLWCVGFAILVSLGRRFVNRQLIRALDALCSVALGYFGIRLLWQSLRGMRFLRFARILVG